MCGTSACPLCSPWTESSHFLSLPSPFIFVLVFWQLQHLRLDSEKDDSPSSTSDPDVIASPPYPQLSSKYGIDSVCPKTVKKL